jgi:nicotinate-nucleotide adenylyltransferase
MYVYPRVLTPQEITAKEPLVTTEKLIELFPKAYFCIDAPLMKISSTYIRESIQQQKDVRYLLTPEVYKYVDEMNFYRK